MLAVPCGAPAGAFFTSENSLLRNRCLLSLVARPQGLYSPKKCDFKNLSCCVWSLFCKVVFGLHETRLVCKSSVWCKRAHTLGHSARSHGSHQVSGAAARNHPSTRAGGQDDVSSNKLPQMNMYWMFLMFCIFWR